MSNKKRNKVSVESILAKQTKFVSEWRFANKNTVYDFFSLFFFHNEIVKDVVINGKLLYAWKGDNDYIAWFYIEKENHSEFNLEKQFYYFNVRGMKTIRIGHGELEQLEDLCKLLDHSMARSINPDVDKEEKTDVDKMTEFYTKSLWFDDKDAKNMLMKQFNIKIKKSRLKKDRIQQ